MFLKARKINVTLTRECRELSMFLWFFFDDNYWNKTLSTIRRRNLKWRLEKFENATITGHFGFVFEENSATEITVVTQILLRVRSPISFTPVLTLYKNIISTRVVTLPAVELGSIFINILREISLKIRSLWVSVSLTLCLLLHNFRKIADPDRSMVILSTC